MDSPSELAAEDQKNTLDQSDEENDEPIDTYVNFWLTEIEVVVDNGSVNRSRTSTVSGLPKINNQLLMQHYGERQIRDGSALDCDRQERRNFRQMGRDYLWSKVKFINTKEKLKWNGKMAGLMYKLCDVHKEDQEEFWRTHCPELRSLIGAKQAQVSKSIGERFKSKYSCCSGNLIYVILK